MRARFGFLAVAIIVLAMLGASASKVIGRHTYTMEDARNAVVLLRNGSGSGVVIAPGLVLTAGHMVEGVGSLDAVFLDGQKRQAEVLWQAQASQVGELDMALIAVDTHGVKPIPLNCDRPVKVGETIYAIGQPMGLRWVVSKGILGSLEPNDPAHYGVGHYTMDVAVAGAPGSSGGAILDADFHLIGITVAGTERWFQGVHWSMSQAAICKALVR